MSPEHVFAWKGKTLPGSLAIPNLPDGFEAAMGYSPVSMSVLTFTYKTPPGVKTIVLDIVDHKNRKTLAKLPGTWGTRVTIPVHPRFKLEKRGGAAFFPEGASVVLSVE